MQYPILCNFFKFIKLKLLINEEYNQFQNRNNKNNETQNSTSSTTTHHSDSNSI